ncbi:serine/threonine-protein kinase [Actinomadura atramentaria]|uniref:serine/threonine-protein kinase n=1 Tax=Actinomadura atramentaria TaxID=1990 RepID=UPI000369C774|nr:serine/threonine-protein kinase [Actinomadura atramentaria]
MDHEGLRPGDPDRIGRYVLLGRLGEGGQGTVYLGVGPDMDGPRVAVKLLRADLAADAAARSRFLREAETAMRVSTSRTARVLDADLDGRRPYIVSEYVAGPSLRARVLADGPLAGPELERVAAGMLTALAAIHRAGVVHRDVKPHNVLLAPDGPRVIDFGIAREAAAGDATVTADILGTPSYMAPERVRGEPVGPPADLWGWAATVVYAATGAAPFGEDEMHVVLTRVLTRPPDLGGLRGPLRGFAAACLDKDPARRPDAAALLARLASGRDGVTVRLGRAAAPPRGTRRRRTVLAAVAGAVAVVGAAAAFTAFPRGGGPPAPAPTAEAATAAPDAAPKRTAAPRVTPRTSTARPGRKAGVEHRGAPAAHAKKKRNHKKKGPRRR